MFAVVLYAKKMCIRDRSLGRVSVPMWPVALSGRLLIVGLVGRYPANCLIGREPIFQRIAPLIALRCLKTMLCGISVLFKTLSPSERQVAHVLLTRPPLSLLSISRRIFPVNSVRLACVRRAASVRPEPGSNSLLNPLYMQPSQTAYILPRQTSGEFPSLSACP